VLVNKLKNQKLTLTALFAVLTGIGGWIKLPFFPVPFTFQTFFVLLSGLILGPTGGCFCQIIYLGLGLLGLPVFAYGGGPGYILQPTFGYLVGFPLGAFTIGVLTNRRINCLPKQSFLFLFSAGLIGVSIIAVLGVIYLYLNLKYIAGQPIAFSKALVSGFIIFLPGDLVKVILFASIGNRLPPFKTSYFYKNGKN